MKNVFLLFVLSISSIVAIGQTQHQVLITYYSKTDHTKTLADAVAKGVSSVKGVSLVIKSITETTEQDLINADAIVVGSPVYNANPAPEVLAFIEKWPFANSPLLNKIGAVFVTGGGISSGEELVQVNLLHSMMIFGMIVVGGGNWDSAFGASAITNEEPFTGQVKEQFLQKGERLGKRVAESVLRWNK
jgi:NAD(P)H dehydrogenase (quinone)